MTRYIMLIMCPLVTLAIPVARADQPAVTVYNQDFGIVREHIALELQAA